MAESEDVYIEGILVTPEREEICRKAAASGEYVVDGLELYSLTPLINYYRRELANKADKPKATVIKPVGVESGEDAAQEPKKVPARKAGPRKTAKKKPASS